jgi:hypothetical protein
LDEHLFRQPSAPDGKAAAIVDLGAGSGEESRRNADADDAAQLANPFPPYVLVVVVCWASALFLGNGLDAAPNVFTRPMGLAPNNVAIAAWIFMALTAARPGEALAARWDQIDFDKNLWLNPAPKTKKTRKKAKAKTETAKPLAVPLSSLALKILDMAKAFGSSDLIFPSRGGSKLGHSTFATAPARAGIDVGSPHSWRSIFRDWAEDIGGFRRETAEAALGHSLGAVEKAYRRETGVEARRPMMAAYANWLMGEARATSSRFRRGRDEACPSAEPRPDAPTLPRLCQVRQELLRI